MLCFASAVRSVSSVRLDPNFTSGREVRRAEGRSEEGREESAEDTRGVREIGGTRGEVRKVRRTRG